MLRILPFSILILTCMVLGNPEVAPIIGLTKFKDLSFYNNLMNFAEGAGLKKSSVDTMQNEEDDCETDLEGGEDDSIHKSNDKPIERVVDEEKPPKTLLSNQGVKVEVNKHKFVSYDTEFTLSLKWRPFRTAKSIKKMLLFFPKKIEETAFTKWEHLRGSRSKNGEISDDQDDGGKSDNSFEDCDETADAFENEFDWDDDENECDIGSDDAECDEGDFDDCDGDWSDSDEEDDSGAGIAARNPADNYPFFVRLSSYEPTNALQGVEAGGDEAQDLVAQVIETPDVEAQGIFGKGKKTAKSLDAETSEDKKPTRSESVGPPKGRQTAKSDSFAAPKADKKKRRRSRRRPGYVLVDSNILVNTVCPHTLNEFKSSAQQWGKKKSVFVKLTNTTSIPRIPREFPKYFPGDSVSPAVFNAVSIVGKIIVSAFLIMTLI